MRYVRVGYAREELVRQPLHGLLEQLRPQPVPELTAQVVGHSSGQVLDRWLCRHGGTVGRGRGGAGAGLRQTPRGGDIRLTPCPAGGRCEFLYGEWLRADFERGLVPAPEPSPDLAPLLTMVLNGDAPLYGPPPADVLDPVPHDDLRRAIVAGVPQLMDELHSDTRNVLLTLARIWTTLATGTIRSKDAAADWVLPRMPDEHRPVLAHARAVYLGDEQEHWDWDWDWDELRTAVRPCADFLLRAIGGQSAA
ncbi:aminoglycoside adenylyltransferase domain-containing protein [Streptomyces sp. NPDC002838]|uniref:aminoglycoside adenylyltransferase domain-containing protein n=1 Tax=Streptomyces sp. NPDC002838 TaxID=3154436 RepID=UPI00332813CD